MIEFGKRLAFVGGPMPYGEIYTAFKLGFTVDAEVNAWLTFYSDKITKCKVYDESVPFVYLNHF